MYSVLCVCVIREFKLTFTTLPLRNKTRRAICTSAVYNSLTTLDGTWSKFAVRQTTVHNRGLHDSQQPVLDRSAREGPNSLPASTKQIGFFPYDTRRSVSNNYLATSSCVI